MQGEKCIKMHEVKALKEYKLHAYDFCLRRNILLKIILLNVKSMLTKCKQLYGIKFVEYLIKQEI